MIQISPSTDQSANFRVFDTEAFLAECTLLSPEEAFHLQADPKQLFKQGVFTLKYKILKVDSELHCMQHEILPKHVHVDDYQIITHHYTKRVTNVKSRRFGNVKYEAIEMEDETGYVSGTGVEMWTTVPQKDCLNILHVHLNDTSKAVSIDVKYLKQKVTKIEEYDITKESFAKDNFG
jgi:hypothetical protein